MRVRAGVAYGDGDGVDAWTLGEADVSAPIDDPESLEFRGRLEDIPKPKPGSNGETIYEIPQLFLTNVARDRHALYELGPGSLLKPKEMEARNPNADEDDSENSVYAKAMQRFEKKVRTLREKGVNLLHIDSVEIEFRPHVTSKPWNVSEADLSPENQSRSVREFFRRFMGKAYRRQVTPTEVLHKEELFQSLILQGLSAQQALRATLTSVLVSPNFLMLDLRRPGEAINSKRSRSRRLASRLSYWLWSTMPDSRLRQLANSGRLQDPDVYRSEVIRLVDDSRANAMMESFCRQWLRLDRFPLVAVNPEYYPDYDDDLAALTLRQTMERFRYVFRSRRNAMELLHSSYAMLNQRLAKHYRLPPVFGGDFRVVALPEGSERGSLITQASVLTMNSDGADSHPIRRGVWIVDRLLGSPPPPPPPNVPLIDGEDPEFKGLSLKQQIELHRSPGSCRDCHKRFDPWGIALEEYDATGRRREVVARPLRVNSHAPEISVDASTIMIDGTELCGATELLQYMRSNHQNAFARSLIEHMMTYALGRPLDFADQLEVDQIHEQFRDSKYQLRELVIAISSTKAFRSN